MQMPCDPPTPGSGRRRSPGHRHPCQLRLETSQFHLLMTHGLIARSLQLPLRIELDPALCRLVVGINNTFAVTVGNRPPRLTHPHRPHPRQVRTAATTRQ